MRFLRQALVSLAAAVALAPLAAPVHAATTVDSSSLYSFADLYRLTVTGAVLPDAHAPVTPASSDMALRPVTLTDGGAPAPALAISAPQPAQAAPFVFSISGMPAPERWLLVLSGLALAAWLARRRLGYSFHA